MTMVIIYIHSSILQFCSLLFVLNLFLPFWCRQKPCRLLKNLLYESLKRPAAGATFWEFGLSFKEHCFHQFKSNLKNRHYEYVLDFERFHLFICFNAFIFHFHIISFQIWYVFFLEKQWLFISVEFYFYFCISFIYILMFYLFSCFYSFFFVIWSIYYFLICFFVFFSFSFWFFLISAEIP